MAARRVVQRRAALVQPQVLAVRGARVVRRHRVRYPVRRRDGGDRHRRRAHEGPESDGVYDLSGHRAVFFFFRFPLLCKLLLLLFFSLFFFLSFPRFLQQNYHKEEVIIRLNEFPLRFVGAGAGACANAGVVGVGYWCWCWSWSSVVM